LRQEDRFAQLRSTDTHEHKVAGIIPPPLRPPPLRKLDRFVEQFTKRFNKVKMSSQAALLLVAAMALTLPLGALGGASVECTTGSGKTLDAPCYFEGNGKLYE
jgi:hypothetical protein